MWGKTKFVLWRSIVDYADEMRENDKNVLESDIIICRHSNIITHVAAHVIRWSVK